MADPAQRAPSDSLSRPMALVRAIGALALLASLLVISLSVLGRHLGVLLPGSVEIVEVLFVVVAASSIVFATAERSHAAARLVLDRLPSGPKRLVIQCGLVFGVAVWLAITIGNLWLLYDVWGLHEVSPLLGIPIVPFRMILILATATITIVLIRQFVQGLGHDD